MNKRAEYFLNQPESKWKQDLVLYLGFLDEYYKKTDYEKLSPEEIIKKYNIKFEGSKVYESAVKNDTFICSIKYPASFIRNGTDYQITFNFSYKAGSKDTVNKHFHITFKSVKEVKTTCKWEVSS